MFVTTYCETFISFLRFLFSFAVDLETFLSLPTALTPVQEFNICSEMNIKIRYKILRFVRKKLKRQNKFESFFSTSFVKGRVKITQFSSVTIYFLSGEFA